MLPDTSLQFESFIRQPEPFHFPLGSVFNFMRIDAAPSIPPTWSLIVFLAAHNSALHAFWHVGIFIGRVLRAVKDYFFPDRFSWKCLCQRNIKDLQLASRKVLGFVCDIATGSLMVCTCTPPTVDGPADLFWLPSGQLLSQLCKKFVFVDMIKHIM